MEQYTSEEAREAILKWLGDQPDEWVSMRAFIDYWSPRIRRSTGKTSVTVLVRQGKVEKRVNWGAMVPAGSGQELKPTVHLRVVRTP